MTTHPSATPTPETRILLIASQQPQQELGLLAQLLGSQGYTPQQPDPKSKQSRAVVFSTADDQANAVLRLYPDLGVLRLALRGGNAEELAQAIASYLPVVPFDTIMTQIEKGRTRAEQRIFAILLILSFPSASPAMQAIGQQMLAAGPDEIRQGIIQGLAFLESPDVGPELEKIAQDFAGQATAELAEKAMEQLVERGLIVESPASVTKRAADLVLSHPDQALALLDGLDPAQPPPPQAILVRGQALRALGHFAQAIAALQQPPPGEWAARCLLERALAHEQSGDITAAAEDIGDARALAPGVEAIENAFARIALAAEQGGDSPDQRLAKLDAAILAQPEDGALRLQRATAYLAAARCADAQADLAVAAKHAATDPRLPTLQAEAHLGAGHLGAALYAASLAAKTFAPQQERQALLLRSRVFFALDEARRALAAARDVVNKHPEWAEAWLAVGLALEGLGEEERAQSAYEQALQREAASAAVGRLQPRLYRATPLWTRCSGDTLPQQPAPARKSGAEAVDPLFKRCLDCGTLTIQRRTSCKSCSSRDFLE